MPRPAKLNSDLVAEVKDLSSFMDGYDVVSFDLFDTLLTRSFARPADVFEFVGRVRRIPSFAQDRVRAEILARQRKRVQDGSDEVTYADIQHELRHFLPRNANDLEHEELSAEFRLLNVNALGMASYQAAVAKGKRIIVVSDMYLPSRFLHNVLLKNGFSPERVFVSGELGVSKGRDGGAFRAIASKLGIEPTDPAYRRQRKS